MNFADLKNADIKLVRSAQSFDPLIFLSDTLTNPRVRQRAVSYMAWRVDLALSNAATAVYFDMFSRMRQDGADVSGRTIDSYNDFMRFMQEAEFRDRNFQEQGFAEAVGVKTVEQLLHLRMEYHSASAALRQACGYREAYIVPTVEEVLRQQPPVDPTPLTVERLKMLSQALADNDEAQSELYQQLVTREKALNQQRLDKQKDRVGALVGLVHLIETTGTLGECDFTDLPVPTRHSLTMALSKALDQALQSGIRDSKLSTLEFAGLIAEVKGAQAELNTVLAQPFWANV